MDEATVSSTQGALLRKGVRKGGSTVTVGDHKHQVDLQQFHKDIARKKKLQKLMRPHNPPPKPKDEAEALALAKKIQQKAKARQCGCESESLETCACGIGCPTCNDHREAKKESGKFNILNTNFREASLNLETRTARVVLITEGLGNLRDRNYYSREALTSSTKVFEGTQFYIDHPSREDEHNRPERSVRDLGGYFFEVESKPAANGKMAVFANLKLAKTDAGEFALRQIQTAIEYSQRFPEKEQPFCGLSINADGESHPEEIDGEPVNMVDSFTSAFSVDMVTKPARGGRFITLQEAEALLHHADGDAEDEGVDEFYHLLEAYATVRSSRLLEHGTPIGGRRGHQAQKHQAKEKEAGESFKGHRGRPGKRGGSSPRGGGAPIAPPGTKPGTLKVINGQVRIAQVGTITHGPDDYETVIKWNVPKTRSDIIAARKFRGESEGGETRMPLRESVKREAEGFVTELRAFENAVRKQVNERYDPPRGPGEPYVPRPWPNIRELYPDKCVVCLSGGDLIQDKTYLHPIEIDDEGTVLLGAGVEVEVTYTPKTKHEAMALIDFKLREGFVDRIGAFLREAGTSAGAKKGWVTRKGGRPTKALQTKVINGQRYQAFAKAVPGTTKPSGKGYTWVKIGGATPLRSGGRTAGKANVTLPQMMKHWDSPGWKDPMAKFAAEKKAAKAAGIGIKEWVTRTRKTPKAMKVHAQRKTMKAMGKDIALMRKLLKF